MYLLFEIRRIQAGSGWIQKRGVPGEEGGSFLYLHEAFAKSRVGIGRIYFAGRLRNTLHEISICRGRAAQAAGITFIRALLINDKI